MDFHEEMEAVSRKFNKMVIERVLNSALTYSQIAEEFGLETKYIQRLAKARGISRPRGGGSAAYRRS